MDESNRVPQRTRPRPYDLRRKVLLKNFLREQMTHIPLPPPRLPMEALEDDPIDEDPSSSIGNEENIEQIDDKQESAPLTASEPTPSTSTYDVSDVDSTDSSSRQEPEETEVVKVSQPTFTRLSNMFKCKFETVRNRRSSIAKAKLKVKAKNQGVLRVSNKSDGERVAKDKKSFFNLFKKRRDKKRKDTKASTPHSSVEPRSSTSNQSVQTDMSFSQEEFNNMEQSNRCLLEENRLLSESLSSIMTDFSLNLSPLKIPYGTDSYITSSGTSQVPTTLQQNAVNVKIHNNYKNKINVPRIKIPRSKSMQERLEKRAPFRSRLRTRSMNYGLSKRFYDSSNLSPREPPPHRRPPYTPDLNQSRRVSPRLPHRGKFKPPYDPYSNRQGVPEGVLDHHSRVLPHRASVLKNLPINNSNRAIVRRSSMPERTSYYPARPILRHKSTRVSGYNRHEPYNVEHSVNNGNVPIRHRSNSGGDYGRPVPFQDLPPEAFY